MDENIKKAVESLIKAEKKLDKNSVKEIRRLNSARKIHIELSKMMNKIKSNKDYLEGKKRLKIVELAIKRLVIKKVKCKEKRDL